MKKGGPAKAATEFDEILQAGLDAVVGEMSGNGYRPRSIASPPPSPPSSNGTRKRRSADDLAHLLDVVQNILDQQSGPISLRHLFYLLVSAGAIQKTEREYQNIKHQLAKWRRAGDVDWSAFADSTRWAYGDRGHASVSDFLEESIRTYRYDLWTDRDAHVELWCEKDAIASILLDAADEWRVQVFPFRGFTSLTSLYNAAGTFRQKQRDGKQVYVYYFGDHDPSGVDIDRAALAALRDDFRVEVEFERVAVTRAQIIEHRLPTRPTKTTDSRAAGFEGESVEIDAMSRDVLMALVEDCITRHLSRREMARMLAAEEAQRVSLETFRRAWDMGERPESP